MAIATGVRPAVGDTEPCHACGHVKAPEKRLHEIACAGLESHAVLIGFVVVEIADFLIHYWKDEEMYCAVKFEGGLMREDDALAWLERVHAGEVERRPRERGVPAVFDRWEG